MATPDVRCPQCGGTIIIDTQAEAGIPVVPGYSHRDGRDVRYVMHTAVVAFCNACEWAHEVKM